MTIGYVQESGFASRKDLKVYRLERGQVETMWKIARNKQERAEVMEITGGLMWWELPEDWLGPELEKST